MKNFEHLGKTLTREQSKKVVGGSAPEENDGPVVRSGQCDVGKGTWQYTQPVWYSTCWNDVRDYCPGGTGWCYIV